jgi:hypothetical protein
MKARTQQETKEIERTENDMPRTQPEESPSQRFERKIREGCDRVLDAARHPVKFDQFEPLSADRLVSISDYDRRLLGVCADALDVCRNQECTPVEDLIDTILTAYGHGNIGTDWPEIEMHLRIIHEQIAGAKLMLRQFPAEVLGDWGTK